MVMAPGGNLGGSNQSGALKPTNLPTDGATIAGPLLFSPDGVIDIGILGPSFYRPHNLYIANQAFVGSWLYCGGVQANIPNQIGWSGGPGLYGGSGAPGVGIGNDGDYYFRRDTPGTANQRIYVKSAGAWVGIV